MAEVLGLGITHFPLLVAGDPFMSSILRMTLQDPDILSDRKDPRNLPDLAQPEWGRLVTSRRLHVRDARQSRFRAKANVRRAVRRRGHCLLLPEE